METRPVSVIELASFIRSADAAGMTAVERAALVDHLARNPLAGDIVKDTGGLRKLRWARVGGGKSGGYRAIYFFHDEDAPLYAVLAYGKGTQDDLSPAQRKAATKFVHDLKAEIRASRIGKVG